jgi:hypothetical protein
LVKVLAGRNAFGDDQLAPALEEVVAAQEGPVEVVEDMVEDHPADDLVEEMVVEQAVGDVPLDHGDAVPFAPLEHGIGEVHADDVADVGADRPGHGPGPRADVEDQVVARELGDLDDPLDVAGVLGPVEPVVVLGPDVPEVSVGHRAVPGLSRRCGRGP